MANKALTMEVISQIQLLNKLGYGKKAIARQLGISKNTVKGYLTKGEEIIPLQQSDRKETLFNFFPYCEGELKLTGVTRQIIWGEYKAKYPNGYSYSHFCEYYNQWLCNKDVSLHIEQFPGDKLYVDFAGSKLSIADPYTGEIREVEVFIAVLGFSGKTYVRACESQSKEDFLDCLIRALNYFGGVPRVLVPDNLKSAVDKANQYEAEINRDLLDLGNHYGMAILPARSRKPRDKAWVERMVQIIYTRIFAPLRNEMFTNLDKLNEVILELLEDHNSLPLQGRKESRNDLFESEEKSFFSHLLWIDGNLKIIFMLR